MASSNAPFTRARPANLRKEVGPLIRDWKTLIVGVDLSPDGTSLTRGSESALKQAEWIAKRNRSKIILVHSTAGDRIIEKEAGHWALLHGGLSDTGRTTLELEANRLGALEIEAEVKIRGERPFVAIIRESINSYGDLVLLGKYEADLLGARIGSVAIKVLRKCPCPAWAIKPNASPTAETIVAASDLTKVGCRVVCHALDLTDAFGAKCHIVHAFQRPFREPAVTETTKGVANDKIQKSAFAVVESQILVANAESVPKVHVECDSPNHAILAADDRLHPDLLVMGSISRVGVPGLRVGSTAERVLPLLRSSLLILKPIVFEASLF